ncbi:MAG: hypothetical protein ACTHOH_10760 [Lysobacteraceae bacterium]
MKDAAGTAPQPCDRDCYETHLTVSPLAGDAALDDVEVFAREHGWTFLQIQLPAGAQPRQPMLTRRGCGPFERQRAEADRLAGALAVAGIAVTRTKIEAAPWNTDVPTHGPCLHPGHYFESHVKLLLASDCDTAALARAANAHGAHLSRNARRVRDDGLVERFATLRTRDGGLATITARTDALRSALAPRSLAILSVEIEYVVHDDNPALDSGWLPEDGR